MGDHVIDGRNFLPARDYLEFVWRIIGIMKETIYIAVFIFKDVNFIHAIHLSKNVIKLRIAIQKGIYGMINFKIV